MGAAQGDEKGCREMRDRNLIGAASSGECLELDQACRSAIGHRLRLRQWAKSGNQPRSRRFSDSAGASTAFHEHQASRRVAMPATLAVAR